MTMQCHLRKYFTVLVNSVPGYDTHSKVWLIIERVEKVDVWLGLCHQNTGMNRETDKYIFTCKCQCLLCTWGLQLTSWPWRVSCYSHRTYMNIYLRSHLVHPTNDALFITGHYCVIWMITRYSRVAAAERLMTHSAGCQPWISAIVMTTKTVKVKGFFPPKPLITDNSPLISYLSWHISPICV